MPVPNEVESLGNGEGLRLGRIRQEGESTSYDNNYDDGVFTELATGLSHMEYQSYFQINANSSGQGGGVPDVGETVASYFADGGIPDLPDGYTPGWNDDNDVTTVPPDNFPPSANHGRFGKWWGYDHNQSDQFLIVIENNVPTSFPTIPGNGNNQYNPDMCEGVIGGVGGYPLIGIPPRRHPNDAGDPNTALTPSIQNPDFNVAVPGTFQLGSGPDNIWGKGILSYDEALAGTFLGGVYGASGPPSSLPSFTIGSTGVQVPNYISDGVAGAEWVKKVEICADSQGRNIFESLFYYLTGYEFKGPYIQTSLANGNYDVIPSEIQSLLYNSLNWNSVDETEPNTWEYGDSNAMPRTGGAWDGGNAYSFAWDGIILYGGHGPPDYDNFGGNFGAGVHGLYKESCGWWNIGEVGTSFYAGCPINWPRGNPLTTFNDDNPSDYAGNYEPIGVLNLWPWQEGFPGLKVSCSEYHYTFGDLILYLTEQQNELIAGNIDQATFEALGTAFQNRIRVAMLTIAYGPSGITTTGFEGWGTNDGGGSEAMNDIEKVWIKQMITMSDFNPFSDERIKQNINQIGTSPSGIPIFEYFYNTGCKLFDSIKWIGTTVQAVMEKFGKDHESIMLYDDLKMYDDRLELETLKNLDTEFYTLNYDLLDVEIVNEQQTDYKKIRQQIDWENKWEDR